MYIYIQIIYLLYYLLNFSIFQKLLNMLNSYSGPPQTLSGILNSDYNACMATSPNSGVCNYFIEANNAYNSFYMGEYGVVQYY